MTPHDRAPGQSPNAQELAAFLDGELDGHAAEQAACWLGRHPEARAEVDGQRWLNELWHAGQPVEPSTKAWAGVLGRIDQSLRLPVVPRHTARRRALWISLALAGAATAASLFIALANHPGPGGVAPVRPLHQEDPFQTVTSDEVTIISMNSRDGFVPVVGRQPIEEPLALVEATDVKIEILEADEGMQPRITGAGKASPMVVVPLRAESDRAP